MSETENPIERLREDVLGAQAFFNYNVSRVRIGRVLDAFAEQWEAVEMCIGPETGWLYHAGPTVRRVWERVVVLRPVPRKPAPTLLEAAEVIADAWDKEEFSAGGFKIGSGMDGAFDALVTAISRERSK